MQRAPQQILNLANCCILSKRVLAKVQEQPFREKKTSVLADAKISYPSACDKKQVPKSGALFHSANVATLRPNVSSPKPNLHSDQFDFEQFYEAQLEKKRSSSTYRVFRRVLRDAKAFPYANEFSNNQHRRITVWCSNDYLGMSRHPKVQEEAKNAIDKYGVGSGGTRNISGNTLLHEALEHELADLHGKDAGLLFTSCYVANEATLHTLGSLIPDVEIFSDAGNHASMIHGIRTSGAPKHIFRANDADHLDQLMREAPELAPKLAVCETVHSMTGEICPIEAFLDVCERNHAFSFVDEVHAVGLYGKTGAGYADSRNVMHRIDAITGTLGKAFANFGGYLVGSHRLIDMIRSYASGFIFTTSLPPATLAASRATVAILRSEEGIQLRREHRRRVELVRNNLIQAGLPIRRVPSHIIPVMVGNPVLCTRVSVDLMENHGIYLQPINYPTVPRGQECLRLAPSPLHTDEQMNRLVEAFISVWNANGLPLAN